MSSTLPEKAVMTTDGQALGSLDNITIDPETGRLQELLVEPADDTVYDATFDVDDDGLLRIPATYVEAGEDYILVNT
ncbi:MAG: PRC-barrel domain-containing protein [Halobacteriales archaeon]|nr:PRC-barrel domain-containing protein [Halobacteriales archaeon]